jgi:hypothetical protein
VFLCDFLGKRLRIVAILKERWRACPPCACPPSLHLASVAQLTAPTFGGGSESMNQCSSISWDFLKEKHHIEHIPPYAVPLQKSLVIG